MVRQLREGKGRNGLVLANGGVATYQHVVILSSNPRSDGGTYPQEDPLPEYVDDLPVPKIAAQAEGEAIIEVSLPSIFPSNTIVPCSDWGRASRPTRSNSIATGHPNVDTSSGG